MRWLPWRRPVQVLDPERAEEVADRASAAADKSFKDSRDKWREVNEVSSRLKRSHRRDRFADLFPELGGGDGK